MRSFSKIYESCNFAFKEPTIYQEAAKYSSWKDAMIEEIAMITKNKTQTLVPKPEGKKIIGINWIYGLKLNPNGFVNRHEAKLVVKGYVQTAKIDFGDTFASVARHKTIKMILAVAVHSQCRLCTWTSSLPS